MATDPFEKALRELNWRRKLTAAEEAQLQAWLSEHPESLADWETELALSEVLGRMPDAPLPSNFTSRVLRAAELETANIERMPRTGIILRRFWLRWVPGVAGVALVLGVGLISYHQMQESHRIQLVRSVSTLEAASLPGPQVLEDFDAIHAMSKQPTPDEELLRLLQ
jgi:anti-sigma factor RsiW